VNNALLRDLVPGAIYAVAFLLITLWFCRDYRRKNPGVYFTFGIVDIWAAIAGLTPSLLLIAQVVREIDAHAEPDLDASLALAMLIHQSCIMYMARLTYAGSPHGTLRSAAAIFTAAILGAITLPLVAILIFMVIASIIFVPVSLVMFLYGAFTNLAMGVTTLIFITIAYFTVISETRK